MRGLLPFAFLLGCAHPTPDIRLTSARGLDPPTLARGEPQLWRARALQFSAQLGRRPTVGELTRSASLWARAGEDARARRLEQRAREVVDEAGLDVEFVVLGPAFGVERVFWDGSLIGIVRAVHAVQPFGFAAFRLELWSPDEPSAPVWVEYSRSSDLWARDDAVDARARVVEGDDRTVLDRRVLPDREHLRVVFGDGEVATYRVADGVVVDRVRLRCSVGDTMDWVLARPWDATGTQSDAFACARPWRASISIDGRFVATSGPVLRVHDTTSGRVMTSRPGFRSPERQAWSREGQWVSVEDAGGASMWSEEAGWGTMSTLREAEPAGSVIPRWVAGRLDIPIDDERAVRWDFGARVGRVVRPQYGARGLHAHRIGVSSVQVEEGEGQVDVCDAGRTVASIWALPSGGFFAVGEAGQIDGTTDAGDFVVAVIEEGEGTVVTRPDFLWSSRHDPTLVPGALRPRRARALYPSNTSSIDAAASARTVH